MKAFLISVLILVLLTGCTGVPTTTDPGQPATENPDQPVDSGTPLPPAQDAYAPRASDRDLISGPVYLDSADLLTLESYPLQFVLALTGNLPTPCHQLRLDVQPPDGENRIEVRVYSVADPDEVCIQVLEPFEVSLPLGSFPAGHYTLIVNGENVAEFDA